MRRPLGSRRPSRFALVVVALVPCHGWVRRRAWLAWHFQRATLVMVGPFEGVTPRQFVRPRYATRSGGRRHEGRGEFAARGARVVSVVDGLVWRVGQDPLGGDVV